jgi:hypothetical protein
MSVNPTTIALSLVTKMEAGKQLSVSEIDALCEAARTLMQENICLRYLNESIKKKVAKAS